MRIQIFLLFTLAVFLASPTFIAAQDTAEWQVTILDVHPNLDGNLEADVHAPLQSGFAYLTVTAHVCNLLFDPSVTLPMGFTEIYGTQFYYDESPVASGAFSIPAVTLQDSNSQTYIPVDCVVSSQQFSIGHVSEVSISIASAEQEMIYTFVYQVDETTLEKPFSFSFDGQNPIEIAVGMTPPPVASLELGDLANLTADDFAEWRTFTTLNYTYSGMLPPGWYYEVFEMGGMEFFTIANSVDALKTGMASYELVDDQKTIMVSAFPLSLMSIEDLMEGVTGEISEITPLEIAGIFSGNIQTIKAEADGIVSFNVLIIPDAGAEVSVMAAGATPISSYDENFEKTVILILAGFHYPASEAELTADMNL